MKPALTLAFLAGLLWFFLAPQWQSLNGMGKRRFQALKPPGPLLVGVVWPFAANQDGMAEGLQLAKEEIAGEGLPIRLELRDPSGPGKARRIALEFANTPRMSAVLGYDEAGEALSAALIYDSSHLLLLALGCTSNALTASGSPYVLRTILSSERIAHALAKMLVARGYRKIALIHGADAYGEELAFQFQVALDALDAQLVYQHTYQHQVADFRLPVNELKGIPADVILFAGLEPWAGEFLRNARAVGLATPILGGFSNTPEERKRVGGDLEGAMCFSPYALDSPTPQNQAFVRRFQARFHKDPDAWAAQGYDALHLVAKAVRFTGSRNPLDLSYAIRFMAPWQGANGRYAFDRQGNIKPKPVYINIFKNGQPTTLQSSWGTRLKVNPAVNSAADPDD